MGMGTRIRVKPVRIEPAVERRDPLRKLAWFPLGRRGRGACLPLARARAALELAGMDRVLGRGLDGRDALLPPLLLSAASALRRHGCPRLYAVGPPRRLDHVAACHTPRSFRANLLERRL